MNFSDTFKKYLHNTSWLFAEKAIRLIVGFTIGVWVARYLGPERLGIFSYAQAIVFLFSAAVTLGLDGIVIRELVKHPENRDVLLGTSFVLKLIGAFIALTLLGVAISLSDTELSIKFMVMLIGSASVFQAFNVIDFFFQSKVLSKYVVFAQMWSMIAVNCLKVVLILSEASLIWFACAVIVEATLIAIGLVSYYLKSGMLLRAWAFSLEVAKALLKDSWPLIISTIMVTLYLKIDQVMLMSFLGSEAVGQYAVAIRLSEVWYFFPIIITSSLFPAILAAREQSLPHYTHQLSNIFSLILWLSITIGIGITFTSEWLVEILFGNSYAISAEILKIHIWGGIFIGIAHVTGKWFLSENLQKIAIINTSLGALINIFLNLLFIPKFGVIGAAYATLVSFSFANFGVLLFHSKTRELFFIILRSFRLTSTFRNFNKTT
ncbi:MAG: O-antigen/teichoic acid export membrane protein [Candidatus Azotimanducaceae bacterium]